MINVSQHDLTASLRRFLIDATEYQTDIITDGYEFSEARPLLTIEQMPANYEYNTKNKAAVEVINRWQIGLHAASATERMRQQEHINDLLIFSDIPYYNFEQSADIPAGFFSMQITSTMPMPSGDISKQSRRHTVYFDAEVQTIKRRR